MIKRNIKRKASGMMLNKPVHEKAGTSSECQQISATDLIHTSCHIWSPLLASLVLGPGLSSPSRSRTREAPALFQGSLLALLPAEG